MISVQYINFDVEKVSYKIKLFSNYVVVNLLVTEPLTDVHIIATFFVS